MARRPRPPELELDRLPNAEREAARARLALVLEMWLGWYDRSGRRLPTWAIAERVRRLDPSTIEAMNDQATQRDFLRLLHEGTAWPTDGPHGA
jgi:hypothetical protein